MKLHAALSLALLMCVPAASLDAMETRSAKKARMTLANQDEPSALDDDNDDNSGSNQADPLGEIIALHDKVRELVTVSATLSDEAIQIHSAKELDSLLKSKFCVMLVVGNISSAHGRQVISKLREFAKDVPSQSAYIYADIKHVPELKEKYSLTNPLTTLRFYEGKLQTDKD